VRGFCVGGGTELALACRTIVAVDEPGTRFSLPEVMLGIVPGWGGMLRLPARIGAPAALDMMLTGRALDARRAKSLGLVDDIAPARTHARTRDAPPYWPVRRAGRCRFMQRLLNRAAAASVAKGGRRGQAGEPRALPGALGHHRHLASSFGGNALAVPDAHPSSLASLVTHPTTASLQRVYHLRERLRAFGKGDGSGPVIRRVHVIGAGVMGGDIAAWCALRGFQVTLQDNGAERIAPAMQRATRPSSANSARPARRVPPSTA
jgi:3-hydroxyacyl-CoA dehydrogenase/enoyl-CoA hydratase/3-hydroxybutyryl-CoA epimerase